MSAENPCGDFDNPRVSAYLFHPRPDYPSDPLSGAYQPVAIPVADGIAIGGRFHMAHRQGANLLFFHGNGEIVADYDDLGSIYHKMGINFMPVDYRGYGSSGGTPTVSDMLADSLRIFAFCRQWLADQAYDGPLIVMGRSLGSAAALALAESPHAGKIKGLIIESGFADALGLMRVLGIDHRALNIHRDACFRHLEKMAAYKNPVLVIHAERDHIIPFADGEALFAASQSPQKQFLKIPRANHNNLMAVGRDDYFQAIKDLVDRARQIPAS